MQNALTVQNPSIAIGFREVLIRGRVVGDHTGFSIILQGGAAAEGGQTQAHVFDHVGTVFEVAGRLRGLAALASRGPLGLEVTQVVDQLCFAARLQHEDELLGKTDYDFFPSYMIAHYVEDDRRVMETLEPILRRVELVANPDGSLIWHVTSKFPLMDQAGRCVGIIGYMRDFEGSDHAWQPFRRMNSVVQYISEHYDETIEVVDLARVANLSVSQFERRFRTVFQQTPARFLIRYRLTRASQLLAHSDATISQIAHEVGFYDHSHFSREFRKLFGAAPGRYRAAHKPNDHSAPDKL